VTTNDYLARRDARWMGQIYTALGLSIGVLQDAHRTENAAKAFIVDFAIESPQEDRHHLRMVPRRETYACDINSASTTCATTWRWASTSAFSASATSPSSTRLTTSSSTKRGRR
jgi:hypothetical protein